MLRVQLINDLVGSLVIEQDDPIDINGLTQTIKRSEDDDGVVYEVILDLEFIKKSRRFIKECFETAGGIDADVTVNIYERDFNARKWSIYGTGKINFNKYDLGEDMVTVNIEQTGIQRRIQNRMELDVDVETLESENGSALPANQVIPDLEYHSKTILKQLNAIPGTGVEYSQGDVWRYAFSDDGDSQSEFGITLGNLSTESTTIDELVESFQLPFGWTFLGAIPFWSGFGVYDTGVVVWHNATSQAYISTVDNNVSTPGASGTWIADYSKILTKHTNRFPIYKAKEDGVADIDIKMNLKHSVYARNDGGDVDINGSGVLGNVDVRAWFEHRAADNSVKTLVQIGTPWSMPGEGGYSRIGAFEQKQYTDTDVVVEVGDTMYTYYTVAVYGVYEQPAEGPAGAGLVWHEPRVQADLENTYVHITSKTTAPVTQNKTIMVHEAFQRICQFHTNQLDCFRSDLLGRTDIVIDGENPYPVDGEGSMVGFTNGANLRSLPKTIFANLRDLIEFVNMNHCIGFGFESIGPKQVLRLEKKEFFYDKTTRILSLGKVYGVKKKLAPKLYYNQIEFGYNGKIDIGQTNAIDEFNTIRRFGIPIINTKNTLKVSTKMRAGGYQIEAQRRLTFSTSDGKLDDENFAVSLIRDGEGFKTKKDEGYTEFFNIFDPPSSYNLDLMPARALRNWLKVIASSLIYSANKLLKFRFGEVNYTAGTKRGTETTVTYENGTVDVTGIEPIWGNFIYYFDNAPLSREQVKLIKQNPYGYIDFEDEFGEVMEGFISDEGIEHDSNKGTAKFNLLQVYRKPTT